MKITNEMMHPELRFKGKVIRRVLPYFKKSTFAKANLALKVLKVKSTQEIQVEDVLVQRPNGTPLRLCVYQPTDQKDKRTGLLWLHGGGYAMGRPEQDKHVIQRFVLKHHCVVVAPDYTLSTEAPYPAALEDCYQALLWLQKNSADYLVRPDQLMVGGSSAGGGLTAALSIYARDKGEVAIAFQMPLYPMLDDRMLTPSSQDNDAPAWNTQSNINAWQMYLGNLYGTDSVPAYAAPGRLTNFQNLPPALTYVGDIEPFYDETLYFMEQLKAVGIPVKYQIFKGCFHAFDTIASTSKPAREAQAFVAKNLAYAQKYFFAEQP